MKKFTYLIISFLLVSCSSNELKKTIILSKASPNYVNWLMDSNFNIVNAYDCNNLDSLLLLADGIVLTGGEDINPLMYGDSLNLLLCEAMDFRRDTIEKKLFDFALSKQIPFVGICRGMQMMNVAHGGTLYGDIPTELGDSVVHRNNGEVMHDILVTCKNLDYVNMIFDSDATAINIAKKIYRYFVSSKISTEIETDIIAPLADTLINNDYKISLAIKQLLKSEHFYDMDDSNSTDEIIGSVLKSPFEMLTQTMSFFEIERPNYLTDADDHYNRWYRNTVRYVITSMAGMPIFYPDSVAGYPAYYQEPGYSRNWFNGATLIARYKQPEILLTGNRILLSGNNGGVQLDFVKYVKKSLVFSDPYDSQALVDDLIYYLFPEPPLADRVQYFLDIFLDGLTQINWWDEWNKYILTGDDSNVKLPLETLFKAVLTSQEYGLK